MCLQIETFLLQLLPAGFFSEWFENAWLLSTITIQNGNLRNCLITWLILLMAYQNHDDWKENKIMGGEQSCPRTVLHMLFP